MLKWLISILVVLMATVAKADFVLSGTDQLTVDRDHDKGTLNDQSSVDIPAWSIGDLWVYDRSTAVVSGGDVANLRAFHYSTTYVNDGNLASNSIWGMSTMYMFGGSVNNLIVADFSNGYLIDGSVTYFRVGPDSHVKIDGGLVETLIALSPEDVANYDPFGTGSIQVFGGLIDQINVHRSRTVFLYGRNFVLGTGLSIDDHHITGTGVLSGEWFDGTVWTTNINTVDDGSVAVLPEPATLSLLVLGGLMIGLKRNRK